ncbi:acyl-CoA thioesterase [Aquimarina longa]|uniref:acyl-CoA thioesterase n=1 Tax=Aquimarina longa TaxID=1080221 RepID=UPI000783B3C1|nr:acyl-CoA thioesterase [Aquimarina longa]
MSTIEELIEKSETRIFKAVFPNTTNHYGTLFGGTALQLMDEVSFICATRFSRKKMVTISTDKIDFEKPIPEGTIVELIARVTEVGKTSCLVKVDIFKEDMYSYDREIAVSGHFKFVAIDNDKKPINIL